MHTIGIQYTQHRYTYCRYTYRRFYQNYRSFDEREKESKKKAVFEKNPLPLLENRKKGVPVKNPVRWTPSRIRATWAPTSHTLGEKKNFGNFLVIFEIFWKSVFHLKIQFSDRMGWTECTTLSDRFEPFRAENFFFQIFGHLYLIFFFSKIPQFWVLN